MARLTWDSVQNPNFSGVSDAYRNMSSLLGNAIQSGLGMVDTFRNTNVGAADKAILARLAGVTDPSQYNAASIIGADGANASAGVLQAVGNRPGTLLDWAGARENLNQTQYANQRLQDGNARLDGASDAVREFAIASRNNDQAGMNRILQSNPEVANLRPDQLIALAAQGDSLTASNQGRARNDQNMLEAQYGFGRTQRADNITDQTAAASAFLAQNSADPQHAERLMYQQGYAPEVINNLISRGIGARPAGAAGAPAAMGGGGISAALGGTVSTSPIGNSGATFAEPQRAVASVLQGAGIAAPVIAGIMGNLHVEGGYGGGQGDRGSNPGRGDGGAASGIAQWREGRRDTFRQRYGVDPHQATHQQQAEYMLWELTTPEGRRSSGVSEARANEILGARTPQEAAELFDRYYERSNGQHRDRRVAAANDFANMFDRAAANFNPVQNANTQMDIMRAGGQANSGSLNQRLANMEGQDIDMPTLTKSLTGEGGPLAGYTEGEIAREIRAIAAEGKISNAQAAEILKENFVPRNRMIGAAAGLQKTLNNVPLLNWVIPDGDIATNTFDRDMNLETARQYREGGLQTFDQNNSRAVAAQTIAAVQQQVESLNKQIADTNQRYQASNGSPQILQRLQELQMQRAMLLPQMEMLRQGQQATPELTTRDFAAEIKRRNELVQRGVSEGVNRAFPNRVAQDVAQTQRDRFIPDLIP